ncbi:MAG: class Ib ribonucleoside-diphosphate reductase assembly flavoprotein NrdI [Oscillospiraceae bacterium]|nr:class Ib ribonucleoside-diphosphate reductase assembly flavoprotein NrdI [Oscillospiraceae bacterium]
MMTIVYASRTGNVQKLMDKLQVRDAVKLETGTEAVTGDYILITYTDGAGIVPPVVEKFLERSADGCKGVAVSGNMERHADTFCWAADIIHDKYGIPVIAKFEKDSDDTVIAAICAALN